ncbi:MAG: dTDP-4-dehydrorhamnose 3,5-epimerase [Bacteroidales bacterium]|jgi:dTDP-4-dehydrorhamnose 3,5-epimerase|nr:dTDP-4-dehydrorhamnose 3,5-epimerase [Bacteroidales bacterium]
MEIKKTDIDGVLIVEPTVYGDARGYFFESFNEREFLSKTGLQVHFVQDNESRSCYGVVRGLHFQRPPYAQSKLVRVVVGEVLDVAVDIRKGSPTYGHYVAVRLSADSHRQFFLPQGMAHGFSVLSDVAVFQYKCDQFYEPSAEDAIAWDDPQLHIDWQVPHDKVILSEKDKHHTCLKDFVSPFNF